MIKKAQIEHVLSKLVPADLPFTLSPTPDQRLRELAMKGGPFASAHDLINVMYVDNYMPCIMVM